MLMQAFTAALRILFFRAGPQDFPYAETPSLARGCLAAAVIANTLLFGMAYAPAAALTASLVIAATLTLFTRMTLRLRKLENRLAQTTNALLAVGALLALLMLYPVSALVPMMKAFVAQVQQHPELADDPQRLQGLLTDNPSMPWPAAASLLLDMLVLWLFTASANIFRQALDVGFAIGGLLALLCAFNILLVLAFVAPLLAALGS